MDNQHRHIKGYRELDPDEIEMMNVVKEMAAEVGDLIKTMAHQEGLDQRWVSLAKTHLQQGFIAAIVAITKSDFF